MKVTYELIDKLASLSRLEFNGDEKTRLQEDLQRMLALVDKINELDTENVEPLIHITPETNHFREDLVSATVTTAEALFNAPKHDSDYFRVPKVLDKA